MTQINPGLLGIKDSYLFAKIREKIHLLPQAQRKQLINLGIGDVTGPLAPAILSAFQAAVQELGCKKTFRGYGPPQGYDFLREAIAHEDYQKNGIAISPDEIFISDGSKCDCAHLYDVLGENLSIGIPDPVYPAYEQAAWIGGRGKAKIHYLPCTENNNFIPLPPEFPLDIVHLCSPNNPTGVAFSRKDFLQWVEYALEHKSILIVDGAYQAFLQTTDLLTFPRSIYEIPGAKNVSIELRSFSKTAGFTGIRCAYTTIPKEVLLWDHNRSSLPFWQIWEKRQNGMFNGVSYPVQKAAQACYTPQGKKELQQVVKSTMKSTQKFYSDLQALGFSVYGGTHAPYIWTKIPQGYTSWEFFDLLLEKCNIICTPGSGFGKNGEGFVRFSAFGEASSLDESISCLRSFDFSKPS